MDEPLLSPGLHDFELHEIGNHFLKDFSESKTRASLIRGLNEYSSYLESIGIPFELWIDGSFTTSKLNPNDIDIVVFSPSTDLNNLSDEKKQVFAALVDRRAIKAHFGIDVLFCPTDDLNMRSYWRGWYGFDRNEQPKGIARIEVTP